MAFIRPVRGHGGRVSSHDGSEIRWTHQLGLVVYLSIYKVLALFVEVVVWLFGIRLCAKMWDPFCLSGLFKGFKKVTSYGVKLDL